MGYNDQYLDCAERQTHFQIGVCSKGNFLRRSEIANSTEWKNVWCDGGHLQILLTELWTSIRIIF